jgi:cytochrome c-type biogenesis protein CcmH
MRQLLSRPTAVLLLAGASLTASADDAIEQRVTHLAEELRCLVCQNQSLADSHADLAMDLKAQLREQLAQGRSEDQVRDYLVQRYGDFVLYRPPLKPSTWLLWWGPAGLLAMGLVLLARRWRRAQHEPRSGFDDSEEPDTLLRDERRAAPSRPAVPSGDRPTYPSGEGPT